MNKKTRLMYLVFSLVILVCVGRFTSGNFEFFGAFWFASGFLLLILLSLVDQPHFSKDSNVFINAVTAGLPLLLVESEHRNWVFWMFLCVVSYLAISSYTLMWIRNKDLQNENKWINFFSRINREIGKPQTLFSALFLWGVLCKFGINNESINLPLICWAIFMILRIDSIASIVNSLFEKKENQKQNAALGKIFGVQSKNTFLIKLFPDRKEVLNIFDFVEFSYSMDEKQIIRKGLILDIYLLNEQQWVKALATNEITQILGYENNFENHVDDVVYKIKKVSETKYLEVFIGVVTEYSTIEKIRFIYNSRNIIKKGHLLEVKINNDIVYYQIIEGVTKIEQLEDKNEAGFIIGEAIQLGTWNHEKVKFESFGWVPEINSPVYIASQVDNVKIESNELEIGQIPNTNFPVIINKDLALTHHTAVIGVTGTGKSVFSRNLIKEYIKDDNVKVICIDFTGEYRDKLKGLSVINIVPDKNAQNESLRVFLEDYAVRISIFELSDVANATSLLEYTNQLFEELFNIAKSHRCFGHKVCVVLEEAHMIIPEWNYAGNLGKSSKSLMNSIAQIASQGRKYEVGLLVIAQRTASVSKSILTQCNTVIAFQEFDKTGRDFLYNYFGDDIVKILSTLKFRQAVIAGKALKSNIPMIFEIPEITEP